MEITIKVTGVDRLADAILALAGAIQGGNTPAQGQQPPQQPQQPPQQPVQVQQPVQPPIQQQSQPQMQGFVATSQQQVPQQAYPAQQPPQQTQQQPPQQMQQQVQQQVPVQTIPTTAVTQGFSMDQLAIAATSLVDAGKQAQLMGILSQFGVQYLTQVSTENYPALAAKLREAGAKI